MTKPLREASGDIEMKRIVERSPEDSFYVTRQMVNVPVNDGKYSQEGLTTRGVNGCIVLVSRTQKDKLPHGIMTHYHPINSNSHLTKIEELLDVYSGDVTDGDTKAVLFHPKMGASLDELAERVKSGFEKLIRKEGVVKMVSYPVEEEHVLFTGTEGV